MAHGSNYFMMGSSLVFINIIIYIVLLTAAIYGFVLFIKLARLGIEALRIYIEKNKSQ
ncbi:hypothetical protein EDC19_0596 [Natranaerovirga hydrolytica]|uniref:Uncharacterized protein n=1 Tax=Natranaerovirga hydrolytica TaxID=680378 RepID=A0A4R1MY21_9FIRM|nr:hypothetical protein [Natranaerovirga hydrolytica]TCK98178.1 hypothetical protein EDC19_0596 [Natranaerovirga hydrolytica]